MIFITGGVRSGKSAFAEKLAHEKAGNRYFYLATGTALDEEMRARIARHQQDRDDGPRSWKTLEMTTDFPEQIRYAKGDVVVVECVTTWLANVQYAAESLSEPAAYIQQQIIAFKAQCTRWQSQHIDVIIVSNELLDEPASRYSEVNVYRRYLGELHQWLVSRSDEAYEIDHQLIQRWK